MRGMNGNGRKAEVSACMREGMVSGRQVSQAVERQNSRMAGGGEGRWRGMER